LHFEQQFDAVLRHNRSLTKTDCVQRVLAAQLRQLTGPDVGRLARTIANACIVEKREPREEWTFVNSALYTFGIVTTLANGRTFAVIYGLFGVPITMIIFSNFGKFIEYFAIFIYYKYFKRNAEQAKYHNTLPASILIAIILVYLIIGALFMPLLNGQFDFFNGIYWSFLCFTAIEYGELIPIKLKLGELMTAIGQSVGLAESIIHSIDLETIVKSAILVKEGKLNRAPQTLVLMEGIWPPELVPLFLKDGAFPQYADDDKPSSIRSSSNSLVPPSYAPSLSEAKNEDDQRRAGETEKAQDTELTLSM
uniref:Ion_trans_2 domain-containing protein n=1 Tax=Gongylonema pulchrum TaxID=637853 RepID=A0A183ED55_9BILA